MTKEDCKRALDEQYGGEEEVIILFLLVVVFGPFDHLILVNDLPLGYCILTVTTDKSWIQQRSF